MTTGPALIILSVKYRLLVTSVHACRTRLKKRLDMYVNNRCTVENIALCSKFISNRK